MQHIIKSTCLLVLASATAFAQSDTNIGSGASGQLSDQFDANNYYAEQQRQINRQNADKLTAIDAAYRAAVSELSRENARRLQDIFTRNNDAHKSLADKDRKTTDHAAETRRIQAESAKEREELSNWYAQRREEINAEHVAKRAAQIAATDELVEQLGEQRVATLQRLLDGPIPVSSLPTMTFPEETGAGSGSLTSAGAVNDTSEGPTASGGGVDVAGTVTLDSPGDELVANQNTERYAFYERLFNEEKERRRRAEEEAANRLAWRETRTAQANTRAAPQPVEVDCERWPMWDGDGDGAIHPSCGGNDCDDTDPRRYPGATEVADAEDLDEDCDPRTFPKVDRDGDGYYSAQYCNFDQGEWFCGIDCDDGDANVHPAAVEVCNYVDDDCNTDVDEHVMALKYLDRDGDAHGDPADSIYVCEFTHREERESVWLAPIGNDCDDTDPGIWYGCSQ